MVKGAFQINPVKIQQTAIFCRNIFYVVVYKGREIMKRALYARQPKIKQLTFFFNLSFLLYFVLMQFVNLGYITF